MTQYLFLLTALLGTVSAVLTGVVTHLNAPSQLKALVLLVFSIASGAVEQAAQAHGPFSWVGFGTAALVAAAAGFTAHKGDFINFLTGPEGLLAKWIPGGLGAPSNVSISLTPPK